MRRSVTFYRVCLVTRTWVCLEHHEFLNSHEKYGKKGSSRFFFRHAFNEAQAITSFTNKLMNGMTMFFINTWELSGKLVTRRQVSLQAIFQAIKVENEQKLGKDSSRPRVCECSAARVNYFSKLVCGVKRRQV